MLQSNIKWNQSSTHQRQVKYATVKYKVELVKHTSERGKVCYSQIQSGISQAHIRDRQSMLQSNTEWNQSSTHQRQIKYVTVKYKVELVKHKSEIGILCYSQIQCGISQAHIRDRSSMLQSNTEWNQSRTHQRQVKYATVKFKVELVTRKLIDGCLQYFVCQKKKNL